MKQRVQLCPFLGGFLALIVGFGPLRGADETRSLAAVPDPAEARPSGAAAERTRQVLRQTYAFAPVKSEAPVSITRSPQPRLAPGWDVVPEKAPVEEPEATSEATDPNVVKLDPMVVEGKSEREAARQRAIIATQRERALAQMESLENLALDDILNPDRFSILGPYSKANRVHMSQAKIYQLDLEERLVAMIDATTDLKERASLQRYLLEVRFGRKFAP